MSGVFGEKVSLAQANGPDVELVVSGDEWYATYQTPDGYPAIYDEDRGLFCYARLVDGRYTSTEVPVTAPVPEGVIRHSSESDEVRLSKVADRQARRAKQAAPKEAGPGAGEE